MTAPRGGRRLVRASELGQFAYCARSWWLQRIVGIAPANVTELAAGTAAHAAHGRRVWLSGALRALALVVFALAALGLALLLLGGRR